MKVSEIVKLLHAEVLCGKQEQLDIDVKTGFASDMMSDVLAYVKDQGVLITGLVNSQVIRTAMMMDMRCIVFVRGKVPADEVLSLAAEKGITALTTRHGMFTCSGLLYQAGIRGV